MSLKLLLHSLFCTVSKLENGLRFQLRGVRKWVPILEFWQNHQTWLFSESTPIGPIPQKLMDQKGIEHPAPNYLRPNYSWISGRCAQSPNSWFGFWMSDVAFWISDVAILAKVWILHKILLICLEHPDSALQADASERLGSEERLSS